MAGSGTSAINMVPEQRSATESAPETFNVEFNPSPPEHDGDLRHRPCRRSCAVLCGAEQSWTGYNPDVVWHPYVSPCAVSAPLYPLFGQGPPTLLTRMTFQVRVSRRHASGLRAVPADLAALLPGLRSSGDLTAHFRRQQVGNVDDMNSEPASLY